MSLSVETYALSKKYTNDSISGISGALAGKNCTIASITDIPGGHRVTFQWTADDNTTRTQTMDVMDGSGAEAIEQIYADNGVLGAKNLWSKDAEHTFIKSSARVYEGNALNFKQGDKLTVSFDISDVANFGGTQGICVKFIDQNNVDMSPYYDYGLVAGHYKHTFTITSNPTGKIRAYMFLYNTEPNNNATLKISNIMIYLASDPDDTYVPYAMTNRELTERVKKNVVDIKSAIKSALMGASGSTVTDVEMASLSTYGNLLFVNARINKAANTKLEFNATIPFTVIPKTKGTVYPTLNSNIGAGTSSINNGILALRYLNADGATYVDLTFAAIADV